MNQRERFEMDLLSLPNSVNILVVSNEFVVEIVKREREREREREKTNGA